MSRQNKVNPGMYTQRGRLTQDDAAREIARQRAVSAPHTWQHGVNDKLFHFKGSEPVAREEEAEAAKPKKRAAKKAAPVKAKAKSAAKKPARAAKKTATKTARKTLKAAKTPRKAKASARKTSGSKAKAAKRPAAKRRKS
jgi:hypothetical protein